MEDIQKIIDQLPELPPEFQWWLWKNSNERVNKLVESLLSLGIVSNSKDAILYLNSVASSKNADAIVTLSDINGQSSQLANKFEQLIGTKAKGEADPYTMFGTAGHVLMQEIASGNIFPRSRYQRPADPRQLSLFAELKGAKLKNPGQLSLFNDSDGNLDGTATNFRKIKSLWIKITGKMARHPAWPDWYWRAQDEIKILQNQLYTLLPERYFWLVCPPMLSQAATLSMLSWTAALIYFMQAGPLNIFSEVPVFKPTRDGLSGGRIDALELESVGGELLTRKQLKTISALKKFRFDSVGTLIGAASYALKAPPDVLKFKLWDWKFSIGDGAGKIIKTEDIPFPEHVVQLSKYLSLASISRAIETKKEAWQGFADGQLLYIMPTTQPIIHPITLSADQKEKTFLQEIVLRWNSAQRAAIQRIINNAVFGHIIGLLEGRKPKNGNGHKKQLPLFNGDSGEQPAEVKPVVQIIEEYQDKYKFLDEHKIVERKVGQQGKEVLFLHVDKLLERISEGKIATRGIGQQGGFISCLMPEHFDRAPSLHISFPRGIWKCFSCGAHGLLTSVPQELQPREKSAWANFQKTRAFPSFEKATIPDEHHRVMSMAQELLHSRFWGGPAEKYIFKERYIDPALAYEFGAGFGDDALINGLIDQGLGLDELIHYGFTAISARVTSLGGIGPLLRKRGLAPESFRREIKLVSIGKNKDSKKVETKTTFGYPYATLRDRVTFPLDLASKTTAFYGRDVTGSSRLKHLVSTNKHTDVPKGGFNMGVLDSTAADEIIATEAVMESLSLMTLGHRQTLAIVGVGNYVTLEAIASAGKAIAVALNNDSPKPRPGKPGEFFRAGQEATARLLEFFKQRGVPARNFTEKFLAGHQEVSWTDFNEYLKNLSRLKT